MTAPSADTPPVSLRVLLADDHRLLRDTLELFLRQAAGIDAVGVDDLPAVLAAIARDGPFDLILLDVAMPGMNGLEGLSHVLRQPGVRAVAAMSGIASRELAERALALGAAGFLPKTLPAAALTRAVLAMATGKRFGPDEPLEDAAPLAPQHPLAARLTGREMQVLEGLCRGKSNKEIARDLNVMEPTVKLHVKTLYRKLGVSNRTRAALVAKEAGVF